MNPAILNGNPLAIQNALQNLQDQLIKAGGVSTTAVTGLQLVREDLSGIMAIQAPTETPLRNVLKRIPGNGLAHAWYQQISQADVDGSLFLGTTPSGAAFAAGQLPVKKASLYNRVSAPYKQLGDTVNVTIFDQFAGKSYMDILQHEVDVAMMNTALVEEWMTINGDSSVNPLYYDGLLKQVNSNVVDIAGAQIRLSNIADVQQRIYDQGGSPRLNVMSTTIKRKLNDLILSSFFGIRQTQGLAGFNRFDGGINVAVWDFGYGETQLIQSRYLRAGSGQGSGGSLQTILVLDHETVGKDGNSIEMVDLLPMSMFDLAMITSSFQKLVMEITLLKVTSPLFQGKVINIAAPTFAS